MDQENTGLEPAVEPRSLSDILGAPVIAPEPAGQQEQSAPTQATEAKGEETEAQRARDRGTPAGPPARPA